MSERSRNFVTKHEGKLIVLWMIVALALLFYVFGGVEGMAEMGREQKEKFEALMQLLLRTRGD